MARAGIIFGLLLCGLTAAGLIATDAKSPTKFLPMMLGIPILFCGVVALNPHRRKAAMQSASGIAALGALAGFCWVAYASLQAAGAPATQRYAIFVVGAMSCLCSVFVVLALISFSQARRKQAAGPKGSAIDLHRPPEPTKPGPAGGLPVSERSSRESA